MRPIAASFSLFLAAGTLFALFILADVYLDADGGPKFEADPKSDAATDRIPGRADAARTPRTGRWSERWGERGSDRRLVSLPGGDASLADRREQDPASAAEHVKGELDAEKARAASLTDDLASARSAERAAEAELGSVQRRLEGELAKSADLTRDLARAREQLARTFRDRLAAVGRREAEDEVRVAGRLRRATGPEMADEAALPAAVRLGMGLTSAGGAADSGDAADRGSPGSSPGPSLGATAGPPARATLPDGVGAHVTVAYARGSEPARRRALALSQALQAEGIDVAGPADAPTTAKNGRVTYYYGADRASAERVAGLAAAPSPIRGRLPARGRLPRPGTVEIAVAD